MAEYEEQNNLKRKWQSPPSAATNSTTAVRSLNDLPDNILTHILSSLPTTSDAIETSVLSRRWQNLWHSISSLSFSSRRFFTPNSYPTPVKLRFFTDFVEQTLILRAPNSPLNSFKLQFDFPDRSFKFASHVMSYLRFAVSNNAETLDFDLYDYSGNCRKNTIGEVHFEFPFYVLRDSKVRVLILSGCELSLPSPSLSENKMGFVSLRSLSLKMVVMPEQTLVDLMVVCVNLEELDLYAPQGCKHFKIRSEKLKVLTLRALLIKDGSIEIVTPNLYALIMFDFHLEDYVLRDVSSLVEAYVSMHFAHCGFKVMRYLQHVPLLISSNFWSEVIISESFILQNLKYIELQTSYTESDMMGIAQLLVLFPNLHTLILANDSDFIPQLYDESISEDFISQLSFNIPSLRHIKMKSFKGTNCEKNLIIVLLKTAVILEMIVIIPAEVGEETPEPPIILNNLQDFESFVRLYPKHKTLEERYQHRVAA